MSSTHVTSRAHGRASSISYTAKPSARHSLAGSPSSFSSSLFSAFSSNSPAARFLAATGCGTGTTLANQTGFEDADGNLAVDNGGTCKDWNSFAPVTWTGTAPYQTSTSNSGPFVFFGASDAINLATDTSYAGGVKQADECPATGTGSVDNKADVARVYVGATLGANGHEYLYLAWVRAPQNTTSSDVHVGFEFNQGTTPCSNGDGLVQRTKGDILLVYNFQSGSASIAMATWTGTTWSAETTLSPTISEALVYGGATAITDADKPAGTPNPSTDEFGEAGIDLTAATADLGSISGRPCERFGLAFGESRTSGSSNTAQMKDLVGPAQINLSNCATPTIVTTQQPASGSTGDTFKDKATISGLFTPDGTGSLTFKLYPQADCKGTPVDTETIANISGNGDYFTPNGVTLNTAGTYYWVASFSGDGFNDANASGCNDEPVTVNAPSLSVLKKADAASVSAGDPLGFTITVSNGGPGVAKGVTLDDPLPGGTKAGWTLDSNSGSATCSISNATPQHLTCSAVNLASGDSYVLHISAATDYADCTKYDNTATASASNAPNAQGSDSIQCLKPSLTVVKTADNASVNAGDPLGFTITVSNGGPGTAKGVTLDDPLPGGTKAGWTLDSNTGSATCAISNGDLTCSAVDLASGDSYVLHVSADTSNAACTTYDNTATASASNAPDATGEDKITCLAPGLNVIKTADAKSVDAGDPLGFTIVVANAGPGAANNVTLDDPLPGGTKAGWTLDSNSGSATCSISNGTPQDLTCSAVTLNAGDSYTLHISADTNYDNCTKYDNTATASASNAPDAQGSDSIQCNKPSLSVVKKADAATVNAGDPLGFTITVSNGGPGTAKGVTLDDPLPGGTKAGWTLDSNSGSATCAISNGDLTCSAVDLASGDSYVLHISAATDYDNCTKYDNTATASASNAPDAKGSDSIQCNKPSLTVVKKADNASVNAGDPLGFTITVSNGGPGTAKGVTLDDPLPGGTKAGWTLDSNSGSASCSISNGDLTCDAVDLASGDSYVLHVSADTSFEACTKYDNTATASASNAPNAQGSDSIQCNKPSLTVVKKADAASVSAGDPLGFTITVSNGGPGVAKGVTLDDPLPGGTKAGWTLDSNSGSANCSISNGTPQHLTCDAVDLASGDSYVLHVSADTSFEACTEYDNTATASASNAPDAQGSDDITCNKPSLSVVKKADNAVVDAGDPLGFTITVSNAGPGTAKGVTLDDPLPTGTKAGWTLDSNTGSANCSITNATPQHLVCSAVDLKSGESYVLHISAGTDFADCTAYDNTATASASNAPDAQGSDSIQCEGPHLKVTKTADANTVNAGDPIGFTIVVANDGLGTAKNVTLDDPLPTGTATGWTIDAGPTGSVTPACSISNGSPQDLTCDAVDLKPGDSYTIHVTAGTSFEACTDYDNQATASASNAPDAQGSDDITCNKPSLTVTKTADAESVNAGESIGFKVVVANGGPGTAKGVTLDDPLPAGTATGWTIDQAPTAPPTCSISNGTPQHLTCSAVDLKAGDSYTVHVTAKTSQADCTKYDNTATASASNAPDADGSASVTCKPADVTITKTADHSAPVNAGDQIGFTVEVKNTGTGDATGVNLSDPLPAGSGSGVTWSVDNSTGTPAKFVLSGAKGGQTLTLASTTVPAGADYKVHIVASTSQTECGTYDNTATLTTGNAGNPEPVNASESCNFRVDLSVTKTGSPDSQPLTSSSSITWTMVVTNNGPDDDTGVTISDPMPGGNTFVSAQTTKGTCTGGAILNCTIGNMAAGEQVTITLVTTPSAEGPQVNTVHVVGDRPETNTANNTATATVQVFKGPPPVFCVAVSRVTPKQLFVGRRTKLTIHVTQQGRAVKGVHVRITGPKVNVRTRASNGRGVITRMITMRKAGILIFSPIASKRCNTKRVGVTNVFTPPVTG